MDTMPTELLADVIKYLASNDINSFSQCSKFFNSIASPELYDRGLSRGEKEVHDCEDPDDEVGTRGRLLAHVVTKGTLESLKGIIARDRARFTRPDRNEDFHDQDRRRMGWCMTHAILADRHDVILYLLQEEGFDLSQNLRYSHETFTARTLAMEACNPRTVRLILENASSAFLGIESAWLWLAVTEVVGHGWSDEVYDVEGEVYRYPSQLQQDMIAIIQLLFEYADLHGREKYSFIEHIWCCVGVMGHVGILRWMRDQGWHEVIKQPTGYRESPPPGCELWPGLFNWWTQGTLVEQFKGDWKREEHPHYDEVVAILS